MKAMTRFLMAGTLISGISTAALAEVFTNEDGKRVECHDEQVQTKDGHPIVAPLVGAVAGGVVGHQFGSGNGNKAATAAGAVGGAVVGKKYDDKRSADSQTVRRVCRPID